MFKHHLLKLATTALNELAESSANDPVSESHYLSLWVTQAIKQKRFDVCLSQQLKEWQQSARTLGQGANLKQQFMSIKRDIEHVDSFSAGVNKSVIEALLSDTEASDWQVSYQLIGRKKLSVKMQQPSSLVIDSACFDKAFDDSGRFVGELVIYIRGDKAQFFKRAYELGVLCYKLSDYKSNVKFHGQFVIAPDNNYPSLPESF